MANLLPLLLLLLLQYFVLLCVFQDGLCLLLHLLRLNRKNRHF